MAAGVGLSSVAVLTNARSTASWVWTWDHYIAANNDQLDRSGRAFENKAERVKGELWVSFFRQKMVNTSHSFNIFSMMT